MLAQWGLRGARPGRAALLLVAWAAALATSVVALPLSGSALLTSPARADTAPAGALPPTVSADALPTVQINGVVWSQVTVGNTVYATGKFTQARPAGVNAGGAGTVTRSNLLAYNLTTGNLITSFAHSLNGEGRAVTASPDGSRVYVAGTFTKVDGATHNRLAAFDTATGALVTAFNPNLNGTVYALAATNSTVYAGGAFTSANGSSRGRLAAYSSSGVLSAWNPGANAAVKALVMTPDLSKVVVGGAFNTLAGAATIGMGAVDSATGASRPWAANAVIQDGGANAAVGSLTADGTRIYGTGWSYHGGGNFEGRFSLDPDTGSIVWMNSCHGDSYSAVALNSVLYSASHEHDCSDISAFSQDAIAVFSSTHHFTEAEALDPSGEVARHPVYPCCPFYHDFAGQPVSRQLDWYPTYKAGTFTGQSQAAWSVTGNDRYVSVGGEFPTVNGAAQQGLVRFAVSSNAPDKVGPQSNAGLTPVVRSQSDGTARVAWQATWDQDNTSLTYRVYRDGDPTPVNTQTVDSTFSHRPGIGFVDSGLASGSSHSYVVRVSDPLGNQVSGGIGSVTVGSASPDDYVTTVLDDGATSFWPLDEASGTTAFDRAGFSDIATSGAITRGQPGPLANATATRFGGGDLNDNAGTTGTFAPGGPFSVEAWFETTSTQGGAILAQGLFPSGKSQAVDKAVYLDSTGHLHFGVQNNTAVSTIGSGSSYNDGQWHHVVGTYVSGTGTMYVDGAEVATGAMTDDIAFPSHWRIGGDNLAGWTAAPTTGYLAGTIGEVAVYPTALTTEQVAEHWTVAGGVTPANQPPTAAFTSDCSDHTCTFVGTDSNDTDGSITAFHWDFGDGSTDDTGPTPDPHTYGSDAAFDVTLTVTDDDGDTGSVTHSVTVPPVVAPANYADDLWGRTVTSGFGTASPVGGAWSTTGSTLSVVPGQGRIALAAGKRAQGWLGAVSQQDDDVTTGFSLDRLPVGSGSAYYFFLAGRRVSATSQYATMVKVAPTGAVTGRLVKFDGSTAQTLLGSEKAAGTVAAGGIVHVRMQVTGSAPTTLRFRTWNGAAAEPATWTTTMTDGSAGIQAAGSPAVQGYLSNAATNGPVTARIGELLATHP